MCKCCVSCGARSEPDSSHDHFLGMLPTITRIARRAFRGWNVTDRDELVTEAIASAYVQFRRLQARGAEDVAFATPLGHYGVRHAQAGRRVGGHLNRDDVSAAYCRRHRRISLVRLTIPSSDDSSWQELVVEDRRATPAEVAITRLDVAAWLQRLPPRHRRIALYLATGESTGNAAVRFRVSKARISQLRKHLRNSWLAFQDDPAESADVSCRN